MPRSVIPRFRRAVPRVLGAGALVLGLGTLLIHGSGAGVRTATQDARAPIEVPTGSMATAATPAPTDTPWTPQSNLDMADPPITAAAARFARLDVLRNTLTFYDRVIRTRHDEAAARAVVPPPIEAALALFAAGQVDTVGTLAERYAVADVRVRRALQFEATRVVGMIPDAESLQMLLALRGSIGDPAFLTRAAMAKGEGEVQWTRDAIWDEIAAPAVPLPVDTAPVSSAPRR